MYFYAGGSAEDVTLAMPSGVLGQALNLAEYIRFSWKGIAVTPRDDSMILPSGDLT